MRQFGNLAVIFLFFFTIVVLSLWLPSLINSNHLSALTETNKEALFYKKLNSEAVQCQLCPRNCVIPQGKRGFCQVRENRRGTLYTLSYAKAVAVHIDPIEKKPLFHFLPGTIAFSVATAGCNLRCDFAKTGRFPSGGLKK